MLPWTDNLTPDLPDLLQRTARPQRRIRVLARSELADAGRREAAFRVLAVGACASGEDG